MSRRRKYIHNLALVLPIIFALLGCVSIYPEADNSLQSTPILTWQPTPAQPERSVFEMPSNTPAPQTEALESSTPSFQENLDGAYANLDRISVSGQPGAYQFAIQISSPDLGCEQYADWWEVIDEAGNLIYRRILTHSHVEEQPFTRSGGPIAINQNDVVIVRAHMHPGGYGGTAFKGKVADGFQVIRLDPGYARELENALPLPDRCAF